MFRKAEFWVQKIFDQNFYNNSKYLNRLTIPVNFTFAKILSFIFRHLASRREKKRTFARFSVFIIISDTYKFRPLHSLTWHSDGTSFFLIFFIYFIFLKKKFFLGGVVLGVWKVWGKCVSRTPRPWTAALPPPPPIHRSPWHAGHSLLHLHTSRHLSLWPSIHLAVYHSGHLAFHSHTRI